MDTITKEQQKGLQQRGLEIAVYFRDFCNKHGLRFYFCGGCCIGALRHGGFIPWDDDVDVFMPRDDYEKLAVLWEKESHDPRFSYQAPNALRTTRNQFATIHHNETTFIKTYQQDLDINHGIVLDIIPLDGCPEKGLARKFQKLNALLYSLMIVEAAPENHGRLICFAGKILLAVTFNHKIRYALACHFEKQMIKYPISRASKITELCSGPHYMQNEYPAACFQEPVWASFEGEMMPLPTDADRYLSIAFGDWRTLPPEEDRIIHHDFVRIEPDIPYQTYQGIEYAVKSKTK